MPDKSRARASASNATTFLPRMRRMLQSAPPSRMSGGRKNAQPKTESPASPSMSPNRRTTSKIGPHVNRSIAPARATNTMADAMVRRRNLVAQCVQNSWPSTRNASVACPGLGSHSRPHPAHNAAEFRFSALRRAHARAMATTGTAAVPAIVTRKGRMVGPIKRPPSTPNGSEFSCTPREARYLMLVRGDGAHKQRRPVHRGSCIQSQPAAMSAVTTPDLRDRSPLHARGRPVRRSSPRSLARCSTGSSALKS